jgi:hypothetical protein
MLISLLKNAVKHFSERVGIVTLNGCRKRLSSIREEGGEKTNPSLYVHLLS